MSTHGSRFWLIGGGVAAVVILLVSWFLVISPVRADTQALHDDTAAVEAQNDTLEAKLNALKEQDEQRDELIAGVAASLAALPPEVSLPSFNRQILKQASKAGVEMVNITVGAATTPVQSGAPTDPAAPATGQLAVPIVIQTKGDALSQLYFLRDVQETGPRLALVTSTAMTSEGEVDADGDVFTMTTQLTIFASELSESDRDQLAEVLGDDLTG